MIDGLPEQTFVELPTHIGPGGARGLKVGALPQPVSQVLSTRAAQQEVQIDAALSEEWSQTDEQAADVSVAGGTCRRHQSKETKVSTGVGP